MARVRRQPDNAPAGPGAKKRQRSHKPEVDGSRVYLKDGVYHIDLRYRGGGRPRLRDPNAPGWPDHGATTRDLRQAESWRDIYDARWKQEQARQLAERDAEEQRRTGRYRSLDAAIPAFLKERARLKQPSTVAGSKTATTLLMEAFGLHFDPAAVTIEHLQVLQESFQEQGYASGTINGYLRHLIVFFDFLKVDPNPARLVPLLEVTEEEVQPWHDEDRERIRAVADQLDAEATDGIPRRLLVEYLFSHGARIQEASAADWSQIDRQTRTTRITEQVSRVGNKRKKPKGKKPRSTVVLEEWWPFHRDGARGPLFARPDGSPVPYRKLYDIVREILDLAGLKVDGQAAHQFRHTYAWLFLDRGGSLDHLQKCLGHSRITTTQKYYDHFSSEYAAKVAARKMYGEAKSIRRGPRKKA